MVAKTLNFRYGAIVWCFIPDIVDSIEKTPLRYKETLALHLAEVVTLVVRYNVLESVYHNWPNMTLAREYEAALVELCKNVLRCLNNIKIFAKNGVVFYKGDDTFSLNGFLEMVRKSNAKCRAFAMKIGDEVETPEKGVKNLWRTLRVTPNIARKIEKNED